MSISDMNRPRWLRGRPRGRISYGADYNPDQWPREVWDEDVRLMREAGVNIVSLAIFSWARLQPSADEWDFGWLDDVMDLLHRHSIDVDLATATASPPPWLTTAHPEILPVTAAGATVWPGARQHWRPTSRVFREHALRLVEVLATRYADHPALVAWHVSNELGCHNFYDYSDDAAEGFRDWLRDRYRDLDTLNAAWGTAFWSQRYGRWEEILPPRLAGTHPNPTQQLDFTRFSSDALKDYLRAESEVLRRITPDVPITTNFMVMEDKKGMNYADWAAEVDFVSNDHYVEPGPQRLDELSFSANLTSGLAQGRPWFLMEHSTSAVNWQPVNVVKRPGEMMRDSLLHVAHGADAVCFFQWRQSAAGAEKYHSAMVPHAGRDSAVFRAVTDLGRALGEYGVVAGSNRVPASVAILYDWESWWASEQDSHPTDRLRYRAEAIDWYSALLDAGIRVDVVPIGTDLRGYRMVIAPILHVAPEPLVTALEAYVRNGGHLVLTYFSGIVNEDDHVWLGGYPGAFREMLGVRVEEFAPLLDGERVDLDNGTGGTVWSEPVQLAADDVVVLASYASGDCAGSPAVTTRPVGAGSSSYVSTRLGAAGLAPLVEELASRAGVTSELPEALRGRVELAVRADDRSQYRFFVNRTSEEIELPADLGKPLGGERDQRRLRARSVAVREARDAAR